MAKQETGLSYGLLQIAGANQTGMAAETTKFVHKCGGNVITGHAVRFGRQLFSATFLISAPPEKFAKIEQGLSAIKSWEPRLLRTKAPLAEERDAVLLYELTAYAYDKEGLVAEVAGIMAADDLDIVQLACVTYPAPFEGDSMFMIEIIAEAPNHLAAKRAYANLEALAPHRGWDIYWKPILKTGIKINPIAAWPPSKLGLEVDIPSLTSN